ncbi:MAG: DUF302 domain-containing protein [Deferrisomatales bacterium]|nr:DUF302 domain-containing protein [Deferrisomatales bacterium]
MAYVKETSKTVDAAVTDLTEAVARHKFGVFHSYDLPAKMAEKGVAFDRACRILEVCNPRQAARVLETDMTVSLALPCRISVYEEGGVTKIGTLLPKALIGMFPGAAGAAALAGEVETELRAMIDEAV